MNRNNYEGFMILKSFERGINVHFHLVSILTDF